MIQYILAFIGAVLTTLLVTPLTMKLAVKIGAVDKPNARKVHTTLMPRIGGLGIFAGFLVGCLILGQYTTQVFALLLAGAVIVALGLWDDLKDISPTLKLLGQVVAALIVIKAGFYVKFLTNPFDGGVISLGWLAIPVTVIWLVGVSNAVNLIDGLDGLSAGVSAIAAATMCLICLYDGQTTTAVLAALLAVTAIAFLKYNFHPAKTFMGDCGALFLGFMLAALAIMGLSKGATLISVFVPFLILGIPISDTFFAIIRRFTSKKPIFQADKGHLHHCLLNMGLSHRETVLVIYCVNIVLSFCAILMTVLVTPRALLVLIVAIAVVFFAAQRIGVLTGKKKVKKSLTQSADLKENNAEKKENNEG